MDALGTQCSNEGHLLCVWQRKIAFIKLHRKQNEVMLFILFQGNRLHLSLKETPLQK